MKDTKVTSPFVVWAWKADEGGNKIVFRCCCHFLATNKYTLGFTIIQKYLKINHF